ncbi:nuclear transport factor 2 family protein [Stigmatella sp. ncwal1]|uniref:Nuclear transport factor 2 family protein n=1 Tax=Stigmatella ashevillensis TaxID=2995309 RepID=A0ABT5D4G8_9BACT|nr:nuclear transport factor 2 family protein [Stigmatella ashevillena]MDC0707132.1 nuclear transport factor 2 family protein [Stigmatella ashevillena]
MDFNGIANAFASHYYTTFDGGIASRSNLSALYRPESMLTWEGNQIQGQQNILANLTKPELANVKHRVSTTDAQPSSGGGVLVSVTGTLAIDNAFDKPMLFSEVFGLQPIPGQPGGFFVYNHVFRLILG